IDVVPVDDAGVIQLAELKRRLRPETTLCSVMYANNEVGTVQPVAEIAALCKESAVPFHTDAVQAAGFLPIDIATTGVDAMTISAHKFNGPKGVGALYVSSKLPVSPIIHGGGQERGRRSGT